MNCIAPPHGGAAIVEQGTRLLWARRLGWYVSTLHFSLCFIVKQGDLGASIISVGPKMTQDPRTCMLPTLDVVVAHYSTSNHPESLDWLQDIHQKRPDARIFVYSKGDIAIVPIDVPACVIPLPNVGRESQTYLQHIINNYNDLADHVLFTQGAPLDHRPSTELYADFIFSITECHQPPNKCCIMPSWKYVVGTIKDSGGSIGDWWTHVFDKNEIYPHELSVLWFGIFNVRRSNILSRSIAFYERALLTVAHDINPEEGHFFERTWGNIFKCR